MGKFYDISTLKSTGALYRFKISERGYGEKIFIAEINKRHINSKTKKEPIEEKKEVDGEYGKVL